MSKISKLAVLLLATSILCSCASVSLRDTWRNPSVRVEKLHRILVVSITKKESSRRLYEDMIISELSRRGVEAVAGSTLLTAGRPDKAALDSAVRQAAAQAVLTLQTVRVEQQTTVQPGYVTTYPGHWYPEAFPAWDLYGYYGSMANYGPAYISTYDVATMQVNLFSASSGKLLWAATLESTEPENVTSVGKDLARIVAEALAEAGVI